MAPNSLYPGFIKIYYTSATHPHEMVFGITNPLGGINSSTIQNKGGTANATGTAMTTFVNAVKTFFPTTATFRYWELFKMASVDADPIMIDTGTLNISGSVAGSSTPYGQEIISYRSELGGTGKIYIMEGTRAVNTILQPPFSSGSAELVFSTYLTGSTSVVTARDGGFPMVVTKAITKTNDALRRKYFLEQVG